MCKNVLVLVSSGHVVKCEMLSCSTGGSKVRRSRNVKKCETGLTFSEWNAKEQCRKEWMNEKMEWMVNEIMTWSTAVGRGENIFIPSTIWPPQIVYSAPLIKSSPYIVILLHSRDEMLHFVTRKPLDIQLFQNVVLMNYSYSRVNELRDLRRAFGIRSIVVLFSEESSKWSSVMVNSKLRYQCKTDS